jgi:DNA-binding CsgD family transcriptional regulator
LNRLAWIRVLLDLHEGDFAAARRRGEEIFQQALNRGDHHVASSLPMMAVILHGQGLDVWSARVFGLADVLKKMGHLSSEVAVLSQRLRLGDIRAEVQARLGEEAFARETEAGQRLKLEDLLTIPHPQGPSPESAAQAQTASVFLPFEALTASEIDELSLLAQDLSDPQMTQSLEGGLSLGSAAEVNDAVRAKALYGAGLLARFQGDAARARMLCEQSLAMYRALADQTGMLMALMQLSRISAFQDDRTATNAFLAEAASLIDALPDTVVKADAYVDMVIAQLNPSALQPPPEAARYLAESERIQRALNNPSGLAFAIAHQANLALMEGDDSRAASRFDVAERMAIELGDDRILGRLALSRLPLDLRTGDFAAARRRLDNSLQQASQRGDRHLPSMLTMLVVLLHGQGLSVWAARVFGLVEALPQSGHLNEEAVAVWQRLGIGDIRAEVRAQLGDEAFAREIAAGRRLTLDDLRTIPHPQEAAPPSTRFASGQSASSSALAESLTAREIEVLRLLAQDLSNPQIAERLVVSRRTVDAHLRSIYDKLGVKSRDAATRVARERGLISNP